MKKNEIKIGGLYEVKLSTGRLARMRVMRLVQNHLPNGKDRFLMQDIDRKIQKHVTAAKLRKELPEPVVVEETIDKMLRRFLAQYKGCKGHAGSCHGLPCEEKAQALLEFMRKEKAHAS